MYIHKIWNPHKTFQLRKKQKKGSSLARRCGTVSVARSSTGLARRAARDPSFVPYTRCKQTYRVLTPPPSIAHALTQRIIYVETKTRTSFGYTHSWRNLQAPSKVVSCRRPCVLINQVDFYEIIKIERKRRIAGETPSELCKVANRRRFIIIAQPCRQIWIHYTLYARVRASSSVILTLGRARSHIICAFLVRAWRVYPAAFH